MDNRQELIEGLLQFVTLAESERKLLAADLHDQTLSDLRELARLARRLFDGYEEATPHPVREGLGQIIAGLEVAMDEVRRAMENLSPSALDTLGFLPALESCLARAQAANEHPFAIRFCCRVKEEEITLPEIEQLMIYRIVQEALNNICKHAAARSVELDISRADDALILRVIDDGCGMAEASDQPRTRGLDNMRYRARLIDARLSWQPSPDGRGTIVEIRAPLKE